MAIQSQAQFPCVKGIVASNTPLAQPKGSVPRASNVLMTARGGLLTSDGSGVINQYNGAIQTADGKITNNSLFTPTGVAPYYLTLKVNKSQQLNTPRNLGVADDGSGPLTGTFYYKVTALDGAGGETPPSNEVTITGTGRKFILTWNVVPNAVAYNVYRSSNTTGGSGAEVIMVGPNLPVLQLATGGGPTVSYVDDGTAGQAPTYNVAQATIQSILPNGPVTPKTYSALFIVNTTQGLVAGQKFTYVPGSDANFATTWFITSVTSGSQFIAQFTSGTSPLTLGETTTGGHFTLAQTPPAGNTTQQTALYQMPPGPLGTSYSDANIVALFPATVPSLNVPPSGGSGGGGTTGTTSFGNQQSTVNGGIQGMVSLAPMMRQFTNRMAIALGNGYAPQYFSDSTGTPTNPASTAVISSISVDGFGVVTVNTATPHGLTPGSNVLIQGVSNNFYNFNPFGSPAFMVTVVGSTTQFQVVNINAIGQASSSGGTATQTTSPISSSFTPAYPEWTSATVLSVGDLIVPATQPGQAIYLTVIQAGTTGSTEPTWPTGGQSSVGQHVNDTGGSTVVYTVSGLLNSAAPPPPGCAHLEVYSGALWCFNTWLDNTSTGLDGPTSLRQSNINNMLSWNPVNQAFLDKDDGTEGMGLAKFTITAQGIPPEGSLVAFKNYSPYQIIGVFGASNLTIQAVSSDMGCIDPRSIVFVPGFGIMRYTHLGFANFNGVKDEVQSEQIRPYLFPTPGANFSDITVIDANWLPVGSAGLTANPPMYCCAMPIGNSGGQLTRLFCFDLVLKGWMVEDLPFSISTMGQVRSTVSNPITTFGGYLDGALQRWQAGDTEWYTGSANAVNVDWSFDTLEIASQNTDQRIYARRVVVTGENNGTYGTIGVSIYMDGVFQCEMEFVVQPGAFDIDAAIGLTGKRFRAHVYSGGGGGGGGGGGSPSVTDFEAATQIEIDGVTWDSVPRPAGVVISI
jgi:hypothetical protein